MMAWMWVWEKGGTKGAAKEHPGVANSTAAPRTGGFLAGPCWPGRPSAESSGAGTRLLLRPLPPSGSRVQILKAGVGSEPFLRVGAGRRCPAALLGCTDSVPPSGQEGCAGHLRRRVVAAAPASQVACPHLSPWRGAGGGCPIQEQRARLSYSGSVQGAHGGWA